MYVEGEALIIGKLFQYNTAQGERESIREKGWLKIDSIKRILGTQILSWISLAFKSRYL